MNCDIKLLAGEPTLSRNGDVPTLKRRDLISVPAAYFRVTDLTR